MRGCLLALVLFAGACAAGVDHGTGVTVGKSSLPNIENFRKVRDGLYRGGHPDDQALADLRKMGVNTIIDLEIGDFVEAFPWDIDHEVSTAQGLGFNVIRHPMSAFQPFVDDQDMDSILTVLNDPNQAPVFVHCAHGQDRTGLVIGLERVFIESWAPKDAYAEMLADGFHTYFEGLNHYFEDKTGYED
jgi:protein tyrosine/serine phosphatase